MNVHQLVFVSVCCMSSSLQVNLTDFKIVVPEQFKLRNATSLPDNKIQMMVQNQTDYIKKIISTEKEKKANHPPIKKPSDGSIKEISLEEYNHCRYLQLLFNETQAKNKSKPHPTKPPVVTTDLYKTAGPNNLHKKTPSYYFITQHASSTDPNVNNQTPRPSVVNQHETTTEEQYFLTHTPNPKPHIKYVQYEPAILQKVVMDDGKIMFYRYNNQPVSYYVPGMHSQPPKTYPTTIQAPKSTEQTTPTTKYPKQPDVRTSTKELSKETPVSKEVTERLPNYEIDYGTPQKVNNSYTNTMKFIIPVPYTTNNGIQAPRTYPWYFINAYQYYRNPMERSSVPMPYVPVYNMIRTLTIPETYKKK